MKEINTDVLVVGAGLVGLVVAHCLSNLKYNVTIVDKKDLKPQKPTKDIRTVAISEGSKQFLESLSIWRGIKNSVQPIKTIKVYDREKINKITFENSIKQNKLGYVVENSKLSNFLLTKLKTKTNVKIIFGSELLKIDTNKNFSKTYFKNKVITSKLIIAADGKKSKIREFSGNKVFKKKYPESALVVNFYHEQDLKNTAYEIFYNTGPLAILPMKSKKNLFQSSIIWSNKDEFVKNLINCNEEFVKNIINEKVSSILGNITKINSIQKFPLSAHINDSFYNKRLIYIGDAAHSIHPIAGQGWNLGIKDVKNINFLCKQMVSKKTEIGDEVFCKKYNSLSYKNAFQLFQITDKLNLHFKIQKKIYRKISNLGFGFIQNNKTTKESITKYAMGL